MPKTAFLFALLMSCFPATPAGQGVRAADVMNELDKALAPISSPLPEPEREPAAGIPETAAAELPPARSGFAAPAHFFQTPAVRVRVTARRHAVLSSQVSGRIEEVTVRDGERFAKGQLLIRLDAGLLEIQLARTKAAFRRQEMLYVMVKELGDLQSKGEVEVEASKMEMEQARADMLAMEKILSRTTISAPFSGRAADILVKENQYVSEGQPMLEILDDSTLELEFIISSHWLRWFAPGHAFKVKIDETGKEYAAVLERLGGKIDPLSQSVKAYARLVDPVPELMEGMSGEAAIIPEAEAAVE